MGPDALMNYGHFLTQAQGITVMISAESGCNDLVILKGMLGPLIAAKGGEIW